jgi:amidase
MIRPSRNYSRRRFLKSGTAGVTATIMAASTAGQKAAQAGVPSPPPASTAPRILRKPPLEELSRGMLKKKERRCSP